MADGQRTYSVRHWDDYFENSESKKVKNARWVPIPNRHDGKGYRRLTRRPDAAEVFCAWCLILQVASKCPVRGVLADSDGPLTPEDLSDATGFHFSIFENALKVLSMREIGWIQYDCHPDDIRVHPDDIRVHPLEGRKEGREGKEGKELLSADADSRVNMPNVNAPSVNAKPGSTPTTAKAISVKANRGVKAKPSPRPEHGEVSRHFNARWKARYQADYPWKARDNAHVKWILDHLGRDAAKAKAIVDAYLADADPFIAKDHHSLGLLVSKFSRYVGADRNDPEALWESEPDSEASRLIDQLAAADAAKESA